MPNIDTKWNRFAPTDTAPIAVAPTRPTIITSTSPIAMPPSSASTTGPASRSSFGSSRRSPASDSAWWCAGEVAACDDMGIEQGSASAPQGRARSSPVENCRDRHVHARTTLT